MLVRHMWLIGIAVWSCRLCLGCSMRIAVGKVSKIRIPQYFSSMSSSEAPRGRGRGVRGWGIGVLEGSVCVRVCMGVCMCALGCVCMCLACAWARGRKETRSAKVRGKKARSAGANAKARNLRPKKSEKAPARKVMPGNAKAQARRPKKRVWPTLVPGSPGLHRHPIANGKRITATSVYLPQTKKLVGRG